MNARRQDHQQDLTGGRTNGPANPTTPRAHLSGLAPNPALRRLEQGGFRFSLSAGGQITWRNTWRDDAPDEWLQPLMAELRERRAELIMILQLDGGGEVNRARAIGKG